MDELETRALRRDRRFVVRLVVGLAAGIVAGLLLYSQIASSRVGSCAARSFGTVTAGPDGGAAAAR